MAKNKDIEKNAKEKETRFLIEQYQVLSERRISQNEQFWNVPLMFLTAQSFLLIMAFGGFQIEKWWALAAAAFISSLFGILSIQIFERSRIMEITDAEQLNDIEKTLLFRGYKGMEVHQKHDKRKYLNGENIKRRLEKKKQMGFLNRAVSYSLWKSGMWLTTIISLVLFIYYVLSQFDFYYEFVNALGYPWLLYNIIAMSFNWILFTFLFIAKSQPEKKELIFRYIVYGVIVLQVSTLLMLISEYVNYQRINMVILLICVLALTILHIITTYSKKSFKNKYNNVTTLILAGGVGKRLQSALKDGTPKFLAIKCDDKTLLEKTIERNKSISDKQVLITNESYSILIQNIKSKLIKLNDPEVFIEPDNKGTGIAILYYISKNFHKDEDPVFVIVPSDHVIVDISNYMYTINKACDLANKFEKIYLLGIVPTFPSTQYGYFSFDNPSFSVAEIGEFKEKPAIREAKEFVYSGEYLWNSGIVIARRSVLLFEYEIHCEEIFNRLFSDKHNKEELIEFYHTADPLSFDKGILEKSQNIYAIVANFDWMDVGDSTRLQSAVVESLCTF